MAVAFNPFTSKFDLLGEIRWKTVPIYPTDAGTAGDMAYDATYFYFCIADNTWVRKAHEMTTWTVEQENIIFDGENVTFDGEQTKY